MDSTPWNIREAIQTLFLGVKDVAGLRQNVAGDWFAGNGSLPATAIASSTFYFVETRGTG
jgi:hypothetical protein